MISKFLPVLLFVSFVFSSVLSFVFAFTFSFIFSSAAYAFPENVRHGYVNCTSCHVSPTGGGTLTPYGRGLSSELMSTWSYKGEEGFLHGLIKEDQMPEWLMIGGDLRSVQTLKNTPATTEAKYIPMGEDIEAAVKVKNFTADLEFGKIEEPNKARFGSRRYFAMYNITDEVTARVGRFYPQFGLAIPDHYTLNRSGLGFDEGQEKNSAEAAWNGENYSAFLTVSQTPGEFDPSQRETGYAAQLNKNLGDSSKVGASLWYGTGDQSNREIAAVHGILGFSKDLFLLTEVDHQWMTVKSSDSGQRGLYAYNRLGYELMKGLIFFGQAEYGQSNLSAGNTASDAYGPGLQFFPRPHFEFMGLWRKMRTRSQGADFYDYAFFMAHYYF